MQNAQLGFNDEHLENFRMERRLMAFAWAVEREREVKGKGDWLSPQ